MVIDGHDITHSINSLRLDAKVGELTRLTVGFPCVSATRLDGTVKAFVSDETHDALIVLGWTPPPSDPVNVRAGAIVLLAPTLAAGERIARDRPELNISLITSPRSANTRGIVLQAVYVAEACKSLPCTSTISALQQSLRCSGQSGAVNWLGAT